MADTVLDKPHAVALLQRLSTDDKFRASYQSNPRAALIGLGIPADKLPTSTPPLATLADKLVFAHAFAQVQADQADICSCQHPPTVRMLFGK
jgi:putative modified peptide